jgi:hypothetical protein
MEILAFVLAVPFLLVIAGLVLIALGDVVFGGSGSMSYLVGPLLVPICVGGVIWMGSVLSRKRKDEHSETEQLEALKRGMVLFSAALAFPIFIKYAVNALDKSLAVIIGGLLASFGFIVLGMFLKGNRVVTRSSIFGGAISLVYLYANLWELGEGARVIAAGFGLLVAVGIAVVKLKDRLS